MRVQQSLFPNEKSSFSCLINAKNNTFRVTKRNDRVDIYRNLHKPSMFTIRQRAGELAGKVSGYSQSILLSSPQLIVLESGRQRVLKERRKHVHAFVRGILCDAYTKPLPIPSDIGTRITYNPYRNNKFFDTLTDKNINHSILDFYILLQGTGAIILTKNDILTLKDKNILL
jgi:hypothetical protein